MVMIMIMVIMIMITLWVCYDSKWIVMSVNLQSYTVLPYDDDDDDDDDSNNNNIIININNDDSNSNNLTSLPCIVKKINHFIICDRFSSMTVS